MKKLLTTSVFMAAIVAGAMAQEPTKPNHEAKVYLNDGNTYVNKALPMYLKFSTSPNGENYDLKSKATPQYADPMYLDTEGVNYIRSHWAVDPETKKPVVPQTEILFEVYADGMAPVTNIKFSGAPKFTKNGIVYYGKGLNYSLSSNDAVSGVNTVHHALNASSYSNYGTETSVAKEGEFNLYFYAHDNVGNAEKTNSRKFTVDLSAPTSSHTIQGIQYGNNILAPSTKIALSSSDNLSGVHRTYFAYDNGSDRTYYNAIDLNNLADGDHTIYYHSDDNVENDESKKSVKFYLDKIAPVPSDAINGDQCTKNGVTYVSPRTTVSLSATDNKAGVKTIFYRIDGGERMNYSSNISFPNTKGNHSIKYDAIDNVENLSGNKYVNVYMDNVNPSTTINYGKPQFFNRDTLFITSKTPVTLTARDYESGVTTTEYNVNGGSFGAYQPFTLEGEGYKTVQFKSVDCVNNKEEARTSNCFVDNTAPVIYHNFSIEPIGNKSKGGKSLNVYPEYTRLYLGATDKHVGTEKIKYSIDGGPLLDYSSPYSLDMSEVSNFKNKKLYTIRIVAEDKLGNSTEKIVEFYVGRNE